MATPVAPKTFPRVPLIVGAGLKLVHLAGASLVHTRPLGPPLWLVHVGRGELVV
jgi:hypothetical protein